MNYTTLLTQMRQRIITELTETISNSELTTTSWKGTGGEKYINVNFSIKHKDNYRATQYRTIVLVKGSKTNWLTLVGDEKPMGAVGGFSLDDMTIEQLASLADAVTHKLVNDSVEF